MNSWTSSGVPRITEMYPRASSESGRILEIRANATNSASTSPSTKLMAVSGTVCVTAATSIGHRLRQIRSQVPGSTGLRAADVGAEVLLRDLLQRAVGAQLAQRPVHVGDQPAVLA